MKTAALPAVGGISIVLGALLLLASIVGIANGGNGFYRSYPAALAGLVGQDVASLVANASRMACGCTPTASAG